MYNKSCVNTQARNPHARAVNGRMSRVVGLGINGDKNAAEKEKERKEVSINNCT